MRWQRSKKSSNVEDRRGMSGRRRRPGGFGGLGGLEKILRGGRGRGGIQTGRLPRGRVGRKAGGIGGIGLVVVILLVIFFGVDPSALLTGMGGSQPQIFPSEQGSGQTATRSGSGNDQDVAFVSAVLGDTEEVWSRIFSRAGETYPEPTLVLFSDQVDSGCGFAQAASGPFYCPLDRKIYIDLSFYDALKNRHGAPGDFAQAYVIAHEVGHHVQNVLGILPKVHEARQRVSKKEGNKLSVKLELQADCLAGLWAHHAERSRDLLEEGDIEEGLRAASAIGDDRLQRQSQGYVVPDAFTHGSSEERVRWFGIGLETGSFEACDTFN